MSSRTLDVGSVRTELARHLDPVVIPKRIRVRSMPLPRNEMGKTTAALALAGRVITGTTLNSFGYDPLAIGLK